MFQDDRMISILSAVVLMVAIGTVIQRADLVSGYLGDEPTIVLNPDVVDARANRLLRIDVLRNDDGITDEDRNRLALVGQPSCGRVFIQGQALQYLPDASCAGQQIIQYGIRGRDDVVGQVVAQMVGSPGKSAPQATQQPQAVAVAPQQEPAPQRPTDTAAKTTAPFEPTPAVETEAVTEPTPTPSVVDTLIAGTAQPAQAAIANVEVKPESAITPETVSQTSTAKTEDELVEPNPVRVSAANLGAPTEVPSRSDVTSSVVSNRVERTDAAPQLAASVAPVGDQIEKPVRRITTPTLEVRAPDAQRDVINQDQLDLAGVDGNDQAPNRTLLSQSGGDVDAEDDTGFLIAIVSRKEPNTKAPKGLQIAPEREVGLNTSPGTVTSTSNLGAELALGQPLQVIGAPDVSVSEALPSSPVDVSQPSFVPIPALTSIAPASKPVRGTTPDAAGPVTSDEAEVDQLSGDRNAPRSPEAPQSDQLAALPRHDAPCVVPPAMTIDVRRAARSIVSIDAPCHADTVAELNYSGVSLAVPLDGKGRGAQMILGFEPNAPALLSFVNGEQIDFDLPFKGIGRVSRVALIWDMPVSLELNALEFGAETGSEFHVRPDNPRDFEDVRRSGGGFLNTYRSYAGIGQNAQIYSFYHRRGGQQGVVELMIDFASRNRDLLDGTCGDGQYATPNFLILRSEDARLERPIIRKLAALSCSSITEEKGDKRLISGAVADLLVVQR